MEKSILVENAIAAVKNMAKVVEDRAALNVALSKADDALVGYEKDYARVRLILDYIADNATDECKREEAENILNTLNGDGLHLYDTLSERPEEIDREDANILEVISERIGSIECPELTEEGFKSACDVD